MDFDEIIKKITPLYNSYKENKGQLLGAETLEIMWAIGNEIKSFVDVNGIQPHTLYREIYGKSESQSNIAQKSYITREFQSRCYRIRNIFSNKKQIRQDLPRLKSFNAFREAMPFFDNPKYALGGKEKENLLRLLNSDMPINKMLEKIELLQKEKIGIKNPRTQRLSEMEKEKETFISFYNRIYSLLEKKNYSGVLSDLNKIDLDFIKTLSKNTSALSQEGLKIFTFEMPKGISKNWKAYGELVWMLINQQDAVKRRRFRRLVSPERIVRLADMLYALTSEENFQIFTKRERL